MKLIPFIAILFLAGCASETVVQEPEPISEQPTIPVAEPQPEIEEIPAEEEKPSCVLPLATKEACSRNTCAQNGGICVYVTAAENGDRCYECKDPSCPAGTEEKNKCNEACSDACQKITQAGTKSCYACIEDPCPAGMYVDNDLCQTVCRGKCVATDVNTNYWCYECRGAI